MFQGRAKRANCPERGTHRRYRLAVAALIAGGTSLVGAGAFASWNITSSVSTGTVSAATTAISVMDTNSTNFTATAPDLLPADYFYRYVDLRNDGTATSAFTGLVSASGDLAGTLTATVERCTIAWNSGDTCLGSITTIVTESAVDSNGVPITYGTIGSGTAAAAHIRYKFKLADATPMTMQGKTGQLNISVSGSATGGRNRTAG